MSYTPTTFFKGPKSRTVESWREHWQAIYDGWRPGAPAPELPSFSEKQLEELADTFVPRVGLVDKLRTPFYIGHRGGHILYPEHSMDGYRQAFQDGFVIEQDVVKTSDGVLVCNHDTTADGQTNGTGAISSMSYSTWRSLLLDPPLSGGLSTPTTDWNTVLNEFGGQAILFPEAKASGVITPLLDSIEERSLHRSVIVQSFNYAEAKTAAARGVAACWLSGGGDTTHTFAEMITDGIEFWGPDSTVADARIAQAKAAGLKVIVWTVNDKATADAKIAAGADGIFTDDPQHVSQRETKRNTDPFALKVPWAGIGRQNMPRFMYADEMGFGTPGDNGSPGAGVCHYWAGKRGPSVRVRWTVHFPTTTNGDYSRWAGSMFVGTLMNVDTPFTDSGGQPGCNGYHAFVRRNGSLSLYRVTDGAATSIGSDTSAMTAFNGAEQSVTLELTIDATKVEVRVVGSARPAVSAADTTHRSANSYLCSRWTNSSAYLRAISVEDLP